LIHQSVDEQFSEESASTRRQMVAGTGAVLGGMGFLGLLSEPALAARKASHQRGHKGNNTPENILNIAATAEVLATIVNTVGFERVPLDPVTKRNVAAAAREELIHFQVLTSSGVGGKELTRKIWVPDSVFANATNFLNTLIVGDQIFMNAYLIGTTVFARPGGYPNSKLARIAAEFMGVEAVHRALARQSLGLLGNDRAFIKFLQRETAPGNPDVGTGTGFGDITVAVAQLKAAGFGFGEAGSSPGQFYEFDQVSARTPDPTDVNTRTPS